MRARASQAEELAQIKTKKCESGWYFQGTNIVWKNMLSIFRNESVSLKATETIISTVLQLIKGQQF